MPSIRLDQAIQKIYRTVAPKRSGRPTPFFFIVGAGISYPPVPLASQIVEHCKAELAKENDPITPPATTNPIEVYSYWFDRAYPSRERVQKYLRDLMEKLPVSKANLRLAHLLLDGRVAHTVFTPNFDDMLTRALELFGKRPLICDHPFTALRMKIDSDDPQIIHVHGSYWFYDCCNLRHDIAARSANNDMSGTLDDYLRDHSPLVVGYSGWEGDIVMSALKRRLDGQPLGTPIYWFCYRKQALETLPGWLTEREDVFFVLPDDPVAAAASDSSLQAPGIQAQSSSDLRATSRGSLAEAKEPVLEARRVFDALAQRFDLEKPPLTKDPLGFFARQLRELLGAPDPGDTEQDTFYSFHTVIATVERAGKAEAAEAARTPDALQGLRDAMSKADYRAVIAQAGQIDLGRLSDPQRREALLVLWDASTGLFDNSQEEIAGYDLVVKAADFLDTVSRASEPIALRVAMALVNKGIVLGAFNRSEEAVAVYDELLRRFADAPEPALREQVANALFNKGIVLGALNRNEEAVAVYDELLRRFADAPESALREKVAKALVNKGFALGALNRSEGAVAVYDEVLRRFAEAPEPALREQVANALFNKGFRLGALNRSEEEVAIYDELLRRFTDAPEPALREQVAKALVGKGFRLGELNRSEEAVSVYDEVMHRFADALEPALREPVAMALVNKGVTYELLDRREAAISTYEELLSRFAGSPEPDLGALVSRTRSRLDELRGGGAPSPS
jgi:tetratricopeptide (TPR) repeat protein